MKKIIPLVLGATFVWWIGQPTYSSMDECMLAKATSPSKAFYAQRWCKRTGTKG